MYQTDFMDVPCLHVSSLPSGVWLLVHWRSGRSFTPRPEGAHILSPLWPHKESQVLRRAWLAALICYLWLISESLSHRWRCWAVNLTQQTFDAPCNCVYECVCLCVCPRSQDARVSPMVHMQKPFRWKAGHKSNGCGMKPSPADKSTFAERKCTCNRACVCVYVNGDRTGAFCTTITLGLQH